MLILSECYVIIAGDHIKLASLLHPFYIHKNLDLEKATCLTWNWVSIERQIYQIPEAKIFQEAHI